MSKTVRASLVVIALPLVAVGGNLPPASMVARQTPLASNNAEMSNVEKTMVKNRAETFGNRADGAGTRYFSVTDRDLSGMTPEQVVRRLSPSAVSTGEGVQRLEIVTELRRPLWLVVPHGTQVNVGTPTVDARLRGDLEIRSSIFASQVVVIGK